MAKCTTSKAGKMIDVKATVNKGDMDDMTAAIALMISGTKRLAKDAVLRASYRFLVSAKAQTPQSKKKLRTLHTKNDAGVETWKKKGDRLVMVKASRPSRYYVVQRQGKTPMIILMPNPDLVTGRERKRESREVYAKLKDKYKYKPHMRAAKNSWNRAFTNLGKTVARTMDVMNQRVEAASRAVKLGGNFTPYVRITNELSYLPKIAPDLESSALRSAGAALLKIVEQGIEKKVKAF
jgi:hypothetical protein